ncbi:DUF4369 domain-containing protein [Chitinophaga dinghuensis]|nr:DUF4369 domain-containing protein [Chitinophaga dinghuensis]
MKSFVLLTAVLCSSLSLFAQQNYTIQGKLPASYNGGKVFLRPGIGSNKQYQQLDSAIIQNGAFKLKGSTKDPVGLTIDVTVDTTYGMVAATKSFFIAAGDKMQIVIKQAYDPYKEEVNEADVSGSVVNKDYDSYCTLIKPILPCLNGENEAPMLVDENGKADATQFKEQEERKQKCKAQEELLQQQFITAHSNSYVSLYLLSLQAQQQTNISSLQKLYNTLSPTLKQTVLGKEVAKRIAK